MKKKYVFAMIIPCLTLVVFTLLIFGFYTSAYIKANHLIIAANTVASPEFDKTAFIKADDYTKLTILPQNLLNDEESYNRIKTKNSFKLLSFNRIKIASTIEVQTNSYKNPSNHKKYTKTVEIIMVFSNFRWEVVQVQE